MSVLSRWRPAGSPISPTAHYTSAVWQRHQLSHPALKTWQGDLFYHALRVPNALSHRLQGASLEAFLLARHHAIDVQLHQALRSGQVTQVIELASGLSGRGWRFAQAYGDAVTFIETDLPDMVREKRRLLRRGGLLSPHHRVVAVDAFADQGAQSLAALMQELNPQAGVAILSEGLLNYFPQTAVQALWARCATLMQPFSSGLYLADLHLNNAINQRATRLALPLLSRFVQTPVQLHFAHEDEAERALRAAGFHSARLKQPKHFADAIPACRARGANLVSLIRADVHTH